VIARMLFTLERLITLELLLLSVDCYCLLFTVSCYRVHISTFNSDFCNAPICSTL